MNMFDQYIENKTVDAVEIMIKYTELSVQFKKEQAEHEDTKNKLVDKDVELNKASENARIVTIENQKLLDDRQVMFKNVAAINSHNRMNAVKYTKIINDLRRKLLDIDEDARTPLLELNEQKDAIISELEKKIEEMRRDNPALQELQLINKLKNEQDRDKEEIKNINHRMRKVLDREFEANKRFDRDLAEKDTLIQNLLGAQETQVGQEYEMNEHTKYGDNESYQLPHISQEDLQEQQLPTNELNDQDFELENQYEQLPEHFGNQLFMDETQSDRNGFPEIR